MGSRSTEGADASAGVPGGLAVWRQAVALLEAGEYEQAATLFRNARLVLEEEGDRLGAAVLAAAQQMCLTCSRARAEAKSHREALAEAVEREEIAHRELLSILALAADQEPAVTEDESPVVADEDEPAEPGLWQRIRRLFERGSAPGGLAPPPSTGPEPGEAAEPDEKPGDRPTYRRITRPRRLRRKRRRVALSPQDTVTVQVTPPATAGGPRDRRSAAGEIAQDVQASEAPATLVFYCLGPFTVFQDGERITEWNGLKGLTILKYLVAERGKPVGKEVLMDVLWPEAEPEAARRNLHQAIYSLRQALRGSTSDFQHIQFHNDCYRFHPDLDVWIDFVQFEHYGGSGQQLEVEGRQDEAMAAYGVAEELYQGDFLEEDLYEEWALRRREQLRTLYLDIADRLATRYVAQGDYTAAVALARKMLVQDPCCEEAHQHLIYCYAAQGQRHLAVRQYQACVDALKNELGLEPSEDTVALYEQATAG